jgi:UDP-N-acetylmuramoylalanine--D-glutamate ligase
VSAVLVIGAGVTGRSVIAHARRSGEHVILLDERLSEDDAAAIAAEGVAVHTELTARQQDHILDAVDVVVPSPGVPYSHPVLVAAGERGIAVRSEIDLAVAHTRTPIIAVTGTNGKTTVTSLIDAILSAAGRHSVAVGNIGTPMIDVVDARGADAPDVIVAEVSSFQLQFVHDPAFRVAVWLNIADDHFDWHPDLAHYAAAKALITAGQTDADLFVFNADDPIVADAATRATGRVVGFSLDDRPDCYSVRDRLLVAPDGTVMMAATDLVDHAPHDIANVLAAIAATRDVGVTPAIISEAVQAFRKLPHRVQWICEANGVHFVDDSKATNPHAAVAAIEGFDNVVLIAGGRNKGLDLTALRASAARLRGVVAIGESADEVVAALGDLTPTKTAGSMDDAVRGAAALAESGDVVLLSPACASFDWYSGYAARGDDFARAVEAYSRGALQ